MFIVKINTNSTDNYSTDNYSIKNYKILATHSRQLNRDRKEKLFEHYCILDRKKLRIILDYLLILL